MSQPLQIRQRPPATVGVNVPFLAPIGWPERQVICTQQRVGPPRVERLPLVASSANLTSVFTRPPPAAVESLLRSLRSDNSRSKSWVPRATSQAVRINIVAVSPAGAGDLRGWASDGAVPNAWILNYAKVTGQLPAGVPLNVAAHEKRGGVS